MLLKANEPDLAKLQVVEAEGFPSGMIEGYASVFDNVDLGAEVVKRGAFAKTLKERLKKGMIKLVDSHAVFQGTQSVIGVVEDAREDDHGLWFRARLSSTARAQELRVKVRERIIDALSFGYDVLKDVLDPKTGIRTLHELKLYEISLVIWGMNPRAAVDLVKSAVSFQDWAVEPDEKALWNANAAAKRFAAWVSDTEPAEWTAAHWEKFKKGHLWAAPGARENTDSYKFQLVDIVDDAPVYIFRAAASALAACRGGKGADTSADWWADREKLEAHLGKIYKKFGKEMPAKSFEDPDAEQEFVEALTKAAMDYQVRKLLNGMASYMQQ